MLVLKDENEDMNQKDEVVLQRFAPLFHCNLCRMTNLSLFIMRLF